jgi:hypothetical protein
MPVTTPRLDLSRELVEKAKRAMRLRLQEQSDAKDKKGTQREATEKELEKIRFSETLTMAAQVYTDTIVGLLNQAGFRKSPPLEPSEKRPRRVDMDTWEELGRVAEEQGLPRMMLVRGLLNLLGDEYDQCKAKQPTKSTSSQKRRKADSSTEKRHSGK